MIYSLLRQVKWFIPGIIIGSIAGYLYYYFMGCQEHCIISASSTNSMLYGATMGALLNSMFKPNRKRKDRII